MSIESIKIFLRFVLLVLIQVLLLNHIEFSGFINPMLYVMFLLMLPFEMGIVAGLLAGFITGITIDYFSNTMGVHAATCVFIMYIRPRFIKIFAPRDGFEPEAQPNINTMGNVLFLYYTILLVLIHHFILFYIEVFRWDEFFYTLLRVLLTTVFTVLVIMIAQYLMYQRREKR